MKESWLEKLWNLLNDYEDYKEKEQWYCNYDWRLHEISDWEEWIEQRITGFRVDESELWEEESIAVIICKGYMFIQRLVENDKIDREKFWNSETKSSKYSDFELSYDTPREDYTNTLLMELVIQDEPIQFLIEILR